METPHATVAGGEARLVGPGLGARSWRGVAEALTLAVTGLLYGVLGVRGGAARWLGWLFLALAVDSAWGLWRSRRVAELRLLGDSLCRREDCRPLELLRGVRLQQYHPYFLRFDKPPQLRILLDWGDEVWPLPLSFLGWEAVWERLREALPELPPWYRQPQIMAALAQERENGCELPAGVAVYDLGQPLWAASLQYLLMLAYALLTFGGRLFPRLAIGVPDDVWALVFAPLLVVLWRRTRRSRVVLRRPRRRRTP